MDIRFDGKIIVVSGGSTGIGEATVKNFLESGGSVIFTGIEKPERLDFTKYQNYQGKYDYKQLEVTNEEEVKNFALYISEKYHGCDVLFNNAGIIDAHILHETPTQEWLRTMDVNVNGVYYMSKYFLPQMIKKGGGVIINTSSISGLQGDYTFCSYNTSKGAVANLTRNMALDYAQYNIRVNAVAPGSVRTSMYSKFFDSVGGQEILDLGHSLEYPLKRVTLPEEVANAVVFLASEQASFITGINLVIDGGLTAHTGAQHNWELVKIIRDYNKKEDNQK